MKAEIPAWCRPRGWAYHAPSNTVFQSFHLEIEHKTQTPFLRDRHDTEYPVAECQALTLDTLTQPAQLVGYRCPLTLAPHPDGFIVTSGSFRKRVHIPSLAEQAAESLAKMFNGSIYTENIHAPIS